jgi:hypothetical protein
VTVLYEVTKQDFAAAKGAFDANDFQQMNILANRLMANVLFGDQKLYAVFGFFMRGLASDFLAVSRDSGLLEELRPKAEVFLDKLERAFTPEIDLDLIWESYFEYEESTRKLHMTAVERKTYQDNAAFTAQAFRHLVAEFLAESAIFHQRSLVFKGFLQEADRLVRNHGADRPTLIFLLLIKALDWLNEYLRFSWSLPTGQLDVDSFKSNLCPILNRVKEWHERSEGPPYTEATTFLCDIILEWRRCFVRYGEPARQEQKIDLPPEARKRIGDAIAQALYKGPEDKRKKGKK